VQKGTLQDLLSIARKRVVVKVAELDGMEFTLRELSGTERDKFEAWTISEVDGKRTINTTYLRARLVALCMLDEGGARMVPDSEITTLSDGLSSSVLTTLFTAAQKLNGLDGAAVEDAAKNSESAATGASDSD